ncbi:MAG: cupin domain-containing protein [Archangium sp.]|nr:cupin domain-containing protein [Archangium sp.]
MVPAGTWFGALPAPGSAFSLVGCTVSPGFEFSDFELARRDALLPQFPDAREWIDQLTRAQ